MIYCQPFFPLLGKGHHRIRRGLPSRHDKVSGHHPKSANYDRHQTLPSKSRNIDFPNVYITFQLNAPPANTTQALTAASKLFAGYGARIPSGVITAIAGATPAFSGTRRPVPASRLVRDEQISGIYHLSSIVSYVKHLLKQNLF